MRSILKSGVIGFTTMVALLLFSSCGKDATCTDGIQNGTETEIDCGGECGPCPTCDDGIKNGKETGIDCGGDCSRCYAIGDIGPGNGKVFYDKGNNNQGWRYLEAAPSDQEEAVDLSGDANTKFVGNTSTALGAGFENTDIISKRIITFSSCAILKCRDLNFGGKTDWYLPSKDELLLMYQKKSNIGQFTNGAYWSSSEVRAEDAWLVEFSNGDTYDELKTRKIRVRAIRRF